MSSYFCPICGHNRTSKVHKKSCSVQAKKYYSENPQANEKNIPTYDKTKPFKAYSYRSTYRTLNRV
jgi:uncharacterized Zn finger protein (UPF0148 family)